jgi:hypothetical protein
MEGNQKTEQGKRLWSAAVTANSRALELPPGLFTHPNPAAIAAGLLEAAERSSTRKRSAYGSAMAMLCFFINRAGGKLSPAERQKLETAKQDLKRLAGRA